MLLMLQAEVMASGNPSYLTGVLPGGANTQVAGVTTNPFPGPRLEQVLREVYDTTVAGPATNGQVLVPSFVANNGNGTAWILNSTASKQCGDGQVGVVFKPANAVGSEAMVAVGGPVQASCITGGVTAITYGTPLVLDALGNLTATAAPTFGTIVAYSLGTLAINLGPTLLPVFMGGA